MSKSIRCPICHKKNLKRLYKTNISNTYFDHPYKISGSDYGQHLDIFECLSCGVIFEDVKSLLQKINAHYKTMIDTAYEVERQNRSLAFKKIVGELYKIKPKGKLLDIGCATGSFLVAARKKGYDVFGVEPSPWAAKIAKKYHLPVKIGGIEKVDFLKNTFDVVTLLDVIEHLVEPHDMLQKINKVMKKNGVICIVTPNIKSLIAQILKEKWWHVRPSHFYYFYPQTIEYLLRKAGFRIIMMKSYTWYLSADYLLQRFLKLLSIKTAINSKMLKKIPIAFNFGDSMEIYASKK